MAYIYSTLTADQEYTVYPPFDPKQIPKPNRKILIYGGANVINRNLITPRGVSTTVSDEELKILETIPSFKRHLERGFLTVDRNRADADKVAKDMTPRDKSAQMEDKDFENKPVTNQEA